MRIGWTTEISATHRRHAHCLLLLFRGHLATNLARSAPCLHVYDQVMRDGDKHLMGLVDYATIPDMEKGAAAHARAESLFLGVGLTCCPCTCLRATQSRP